MSNRLKTIADALEWALGRISDRGDYWYTASALLQLDRTTDHAGAAAPLPASPDLIEMEARKDAAYLERNQVVSALAKAYPSGIARTAIEGWSEDWHGCVYIDLPTGQASWHFHDSQAHLFDGLPPYVGTWDGHDTPEKYRRLAALPASPAQPVVAAQVEIGVDRMVESVNGVSWWPYLKVGTRKHHSNKYGADFENRANFEAALMRWVLLGADKPYIMDYGDAAPKVEAPVARAEGEALSIEACPTCGLAGRAIADERDAYAISLPQWKSLAESLLEMVEHINRELGIDDESQETANGAGEILDRISDLKAENFALKRAATPKAEPPASGLRAETDAGGEVGKDCPHAAPFRYCPQCVVSPCPIGLGGKHD